MSSCTDRPAPRRHRRLSDEALLAELEPLAGQLLERHLTMAKEWFPHGLVPYGRGRSARPGARWTPDDADLDGVEIDDAVRSALVVNLLTEDNLPHYFTVIERLFGRHGPWIEWACRWTAEEARHSMVIYGYLMTTRAVDPVMLERSRMVQVSAGKVPRPASVVDGLVYVALQELATRVAHRNTGQRLDIAGQEVMKRVAADENLHHLFYRDLVTAAIELDPSSTMEAIERQVRDFEMPGVGIPQFAEHAASIAAAGIFNLSSLHHQVFVPVVERHWDVAEVHDLDDAAAAARDRLLRRLARSARVAQRLDDRHHRRPAHRADHQHDRIPAR